MRGTDEANDGLTGTHHDFDDPPSRPWYAVALEIVTYMVLPVIREGYKDLPDRRARWAAGAAVTGMTAGVAVLGARLDPSLRRTTQGRERGGPDPEVYAARKSDPEFLAETRRRAALSFAYLVVLELGKRALLVELRRRGVRRPHLLTGVAVAATRLAVTGSRRLVARNRRARPGAGAAGNP